MYARLKSHLISRTSGFPDSFNQATYNFFTPSIASPRNPFPLISSCTSSRKLPITSTSRAHVSLFPSNSIVRKFGKYGRSSNDVRWLFDRSNVWRLARVCRPERSHRRLFPRYKQARLQRWSMFWMVEIALFSRYKVFRPVKSWGWK